MACFCFVLVKMNELNEFPLNPGVFENCFIQEPSLTLPFLQTRKLLIDPADAVLYAPLRAAVRSQRQLRRRLRPRELQAQMAAEESRAARDQAVIQQLKLDLYVHGET
jgi:hypothetical protein